MARKRLVVVWWGGNAILSRTFPVDHEVVVGDDPSADIVLPAVAPGGERGAGGDIVVEVLTTGDEDELRAPRRRLGLHGWSLFSAAAHVAVLLALALGAALRPASKLDEQRARVDAMQGYMARIAEHEDERQGGISSADDGDSVSAAHAGPAAQASMEDAFGEHGTGAGNGSATSSGTGAQTTGHHIDDHNPSDAKLARSSGDDRGGTRSSAKDKGGHDSFASTPSTLAPRLGPTKLVDGKRAGRTGRALASSGVSGGSGEGPGGASSCKTFYGTPHDPNAAWIEFELVHEDQSPVVGEPYRVTLPDGSVRQGTTDRRGLVCITGISHGNATIEWLGIAKNRAKYMGSSDAPI